MNELGKFMEYYTYQIRIGMNIGFTHLHIADGSSAGENARLKCALCINSKLPTNLYLKTIVFVLILYFNTTFIYFVTTFYNIHCKGMRSQSHMKIYRKFFVWLLILCRSDDGLIDKPNW
jgi:hypothetical protein